MIEQLTLEGISLTGIFKGEKIKEGSTSSNCEAADFEYPYTTHHYEGFGSITDKTTREKKTLRFKTRQTRISGICFAGHVPSIAPENPQSPHESYSQITSAECAEAFLKRIIERINKSNSEVPLIAN